MNNNVKYLILNIILLIGCKERHENNTEVVAERVDASNFFSDSITAFFKTMFLVDIDTFCGMTPYLSAAPSERTDVVFKCRFYVQCRYYSGDLVQEIREEKGDEKYNVIYLSDGSILYRGEKYGFSDLGRFFTNVEKVNSGMSQSFYVIRNDWTKGDNVQGFFTAIMQHMEKTENKNYDFVFEYRNKKFYEDYNSYKPKATPSPLKD